MGFLYIFYDDVIGAYQNVFSTVMHADLSLEYMFVLILYLVLISDKSFHA